jgi:hypothetical protein
MLAEGWGELAEEVGAGLAPAQLRHSALLRAMPSAAAAAGIAPPTPPSASKPGIFGMFKRGQNPPAPSDPSLDRSLDPCIDLGLSDSNISGVAPVTTPKREDPLQSLLNAQVADGSFEGAAAISDLLGTDESSVWTMARAAVATGPMTSAPQALVYRLARSLIVIALLRERFPDREPIWRRAEQKALRYLAKAMAIDAAAVEALLAPIWDKLRQAVK